MDLKYETFPQDWKEYIQNFRRSAETLRSYESKMGAIMSVDLPLINPSPVFALSDAEAQPSADNCIKRIKV